MPRLNDLTASQLRKWFADHGHKPGKLAMLKLTSKSDRLAAVKALHAGKIGA